MLEHCLLLILLLMAAVMLHFSAINARDDRYYNLYSSVCIKTRQLVTLVKVDQQYYNLYCTLEHIKNNTPICVL